MQMSAAPVKSQSLRNFSSLPFPGWGSHNASASAAANDVASSADPGADRASSPAAAVAAPHRGVGSRSSRQQRFSFTSLAPSASVKPLTDGRETAASEEKPTEAVVKKENEEEGEEEAEEVKRTWNLRPRKGFSKKNFVFSPEMYGGGVSDGGSLKPSGSESKSNRLRGLASESPGLGGGDRKNEKVKLWIALSRDEIEEDVFIMTGNRPSRRPKKRPKIVQQQLDSVFPGLWLVGMTADCYRITDAPVKG